MHCEKGTKFYLIRNNLSKSRSIHIHQAIYEFLGLDYSYEPTSFKNKEELNAFLKKRIECGGFVSNVTFPFKQYCCEYFKKLGYTIPEICEYSKACNLIISDNHKVYNYDGLGFIKSLQINNVSSTSKNIAIFGTGATAKSVCFELQKSKPNSIIFISRNPGDKQDLDKLAISYEQINKYKKDIDIFIDARPFTAKDKYLLDYESYNKSSVVIDISYSDAETKVVQGAKKAGLKSFDGKTMLVCQAVLCIQELCKAINFSNGKINDFEKLYEIGAKAIKI